jgi:hypothetical protein
MNIGLQSDALSLAALQRYEQARESAVRSRLVSVCQREVCDRVCSEATVWLSELLLTATRLFLEAEGRTA